MEIRRFQQRITAWGDKCFGEEVNGNVRIRRNVFMEEAIELFQALGGSAAELTAIMERTYSRPVGEVDTEIGGTMVTLSLLTQALEKDLDDLSWTEMQRCEEKIELIRAKREQKPHAQLE